jgi:lysophospholipase L1-like esterase
MQMVKAFSKGDQKIDESLFSDGLHPNEQGYRKLGEFISNHIKHNWWRFAIIS